MERLKRVITNKTMLRASVILVSLVIPLLISIPAMANSLLNGQAGATLGYGYGSGSTGANWPLIGWITGGVIILGAGAYALIHYFANRPK